MPAIIRSFDSYKIYHFAGRKPIDGRMLAAWIQCFHNGKQVGSLGFLNDRADISGNNFEHDQILLYYHIDRFEEIVTTLRYESPLFLMLNTDTSEGALITKELEPVGEEESK